MKLRSLNSGLRFLTPFAGVFVGVLVGLAVLWPGAATMAAEDVVFGHSQATVVTEKGRFIISVETANTDRQRARGLMFRTFMAPNAGMLFDFGRVRPIAMWMKNTVLPLDMVFIDATGRVANVADHTQPHDLTEIPSAGPVLAVLELNAGIAAQLAIRPGSWVEHAMFGNATFGK